MAENNKSTSEDKSPASRWEKHLFPVVVVAMALVMVSMVIFIGVQMYTILNRNNHDSFDMSVYVMPDPDQQATLEAAGEESPEILLNPTQQAQFREQIRRENLNIAVNARDNAQDAVNSAQLLLSFLEAAGFLIALALGAAAMYGFRNSREMRDDLEKESSRLFDQIERQLDIAKDLTEAQSSAVMIRADQLQQSTRRFEQDTQKLQQDLIQHQNTLNDLQSQLVSLEKVGENFKNTPDFFRYLMQAYHELQLRNHLTAYRAIRKALSFDPKNPVALYYAGWLEIQYVPDTVNPNHMQDGMENLEQAFELAPEWPSAIAAYGVALRRQAMRETGEERLTFFKKAEDRFEQALDMDRTLLDLNQESFWGPLAGLRRDRERLKPADERDYTHVITAYQEAVSITPGSSYPRGNLASLYLWQYKQHPTPEHEQIALETFDTTVRLAQIELALEPNDYYHIMDVAMGMTVVGSQGYADYTEAESDRQLDEALKMVTTPEMKQVSLRGWDYLMEYCPDEWTKLRENIEKARARIQASI